MQIPETAKPAHPDGGGPRKFEQLGGQLGSTNSTNDFPTQNNALVNTFNGAQCDTSKPVPTSPQPSCATRMAAKSRAKTMTGVCCECGAKFTAQRATKEFCSTKHRQDFNNRKAIRGAAIYDLAMEWRADRNAKLAFSLLCRMLSDFREEDDRAGRRSWNSALSVVHAKPYLSATMLDTNIAGLRRQDRRKRVRP
jgi:hypothetical protein